MVDSDEVSSVQVKVLNAQYEVTVVYQVLRLLHVDVVLTGRGLWRVVRLRLTRKTFLYLGHTRGFDKWRVDIKSRIRSRRVQIRSRIRSEVEDILRELSF